MKYLAEFLKKILGIFNKPKLPHPEEPPDYTRTLENTVLDKVVNKWLRDWEVSNPKFWDSVDFKLSYQYPYPACSIAQTKEVFVRPEWANAGAIAHEVAHIVHYSLTPRDRANFNHTFCSLLRTDPLMKLLDSKNDYMNKRVIERFTEVYRYLGQFMPQELKHFYPNLL